MKIYHSFIKAKCIGVDELASYKFGILVETEIYENLGKFLLLFIFLFRA